MAVIDLQWRDVGRVANVVADLVAGKDGPPLSDMLTALAQRAADSAKVAGPASDLPSPRTLAPDVLALADRAHDALCRRYGDDYAADLWARLRK